MLEEFIKNLNRYRYCDLSNTELAIISFLLLQENYKLVKIGDDASVTDEHIIISRLSFIWETTKVIDEDEIKTRAYHYITRRKVAINNKIM